MQLGELIGAMGDFASEMRALYHIWLAVGLAIDIAVPMSVIRSKFRMLQWLRFERN